MDIDENTFTEVDSFFTKSKLSETEIHLLYAYLKNVMTLPDSELVRFLETVNK